MGSKSGPEAVPHAQGFLKGTPMLIVQLASGVMSKIVTCLAVLGAALTIPHAAPNPTAPSPRGHIVEAWQHSRQPETAVISAHRGGAGQWPQDSLLAFRRAIRAGYAEIEADAWMTRDRVPVIYHDETVGPTRCPGVYAGREIRSLTLAEIARIRCERQPIPTETQVVDLVAHHPDARLRLEAKTYTGQSPQQARAWAASITRPVVDAGLAPRTIMQDFDWLGIAGFHQVDPSLRVSALIGTPTLADVSRAASLGAYDLSYRAADATRALNRAITTAGLVPTVWGVDSVPAAPGHASAATMRAAAVATRRAVALGARVVITNYPGAVSMWGVYRLSIMNTGGPIAQTARVS